MSDSSDNQESSSKQELDSLNPRELWGEFRSALQAPPLNKLKLFQLFRRLPKDQQEAAHMYLARTLALPESLSTISLLGHTQKPMYALRLIVGNSTAHKHWVEYSTHEDHETDQRVLEALQAFLEAFEACSDSERTRFAHTWCLLSLDDQPQPPTLREPLLHELVVPYLHNAISEAPDDSDLLTQHLVWLAKLHDHTEECPACLGHINRMEQSRRKLLHKILDLRW